MSSLFDRAHDALAEADLQRRHGRVRDLIGLIVEATGLEAEVGEVCHIETGRRRTGRTASIPAEVVGFRGGRTLLMALGDPEGMAPGARVTATGRSLRVPVTGALLGRAVDGLGNPMDGGGPILDGLVPSRPAMAAPPDALERPRIEE